MAIERHVVCRQDELPPGKRRIVEAGGRSIGVFNVHGRYYALKNVCPHQQAPLCLGRVAGTTLPGAVGEYRYGREGEIIRCPWHGWEFDLTTGRSIFNPHRVRVKTYEVAVEPSASTVSPPGACDPPEARPDRPAPRADEAEDPSVETFDVVVEGSWVVLYA
ncbi:MAG TPA: Rieske (2Fe-2S) protein [Limnochordia bacterium]|nr:Rieske (2Fe-2S) protein [Limnochordia bacterium]